MPAEMVVFAFDPCEQLGGRPGLHIVPEAVAKDMHAVGLAEPVHPHALQQNRYVEGSPAWRAARAALRRIRDGEQTVAVTMVQDEPPRRRARQGRAHA